MVIRMRNSATNANFTVRASPAMALVLSALS